MCEKLHRHFQWVGVALYLLALLTVSLCFRSYALKPLWMAWGMATVLFFFGLSYVCHRRWRNDDSVLFRRKVFWWALGIRAVYIGGILFYYYFETGVSFEYGAADSWNYHRMAGFLADLAREGRFRELLYVLNGNTLGFSDQGYTLYLTALYTCFGKNILGPRLLKALMSAYLCVAIYKLAQRNLGERTARMAAVMAVFLPQFIHYTGTYMKETEMVFLATLALERFDALVHTRKRWVGNALLVALLTVLTFGFRTLVGMALLASFVVYVVCCDKALLSLRARVVTVCLTVLFALLLLMTPVGWEMGMMAKIRFATSDALVEKYQALGLGYAEYASGKYMAPGFFTLPLANLVEVANPSQKMMNGTYFVKNYLAFFALWCLVVAFREKRWRNLSLIGSFTVLYALAVAFSFAFNSERYHLPVMPGLLVMAAFAMTHFRKKDFKFFYVYGFVLLVAIVIWNYLKLSGRGLI